MKKFIFLASSLFSIVFSENLQNDPDRKFSMFYIQPECFIDKKSIIPAIGLGYRLHLKQHGFDVSINAFPIESCGRFGAIPFIKSSYLNYPLYSKNNYFYFGVGAIATYGYIRPIATIGDEFYHGKKVTFFIQLDGTYPAAGIFAIGMGF